MSNFFRTLCWSLRREFWEHRWLYIAPALAALQFLVGFLIVTVAGKRYAIAMPYDIAAGFLMIVGMVVGAMYSVQALQGERRDRSILFWKSLPVSDRTTVIAKAIIPIFFLPLLTFAITFILQSLMLLASSIALWARGQNPATLWAELSFPRMTLLLLYHLLTIHALWQAPVYGWLLLVSAWARRAALLWAILPPFALGVFEKIVFGTSYLTNVLEYRIGGGGQEAMTAPGTFPMDPMTHVTFGQYLISPGLWIGLALTAGFIALAVRLRRTREPSWS